MGDELLPTQTVFRIGRGRVQHAWSVHIVDNAVQVQTRCGIVLTGNDDAARTEGFVTCEACA